MSLTGEMRKGRCCNYRNDTRTSKHDKELSTFINTTFGFVVVPSLAEQKLSGFLSQRPCNYLRCITNFLGWLSHMDE